MAHYSMASHTRPPPGKSMGWKDLIKKITQTTKEEKSNTIIINVGGEVFKTSKDHFKRFPKTRLADLDANSGTYEESTNSYFFDRNPVLFHYILDYYKSGELHIPHNVCYRLVESELSYWQIEYSEMTDCCKKMVEEDFDEYASEESLQQELKVQPKIYSSQSKHVPDYISNWRIRTWEFLDDQCSSTKATKIWHAVYMILVMISILSFFCATLSECRVSLDESIYRFGSTTNTTQEITSDEIPKIKKLLNTVPHPVLQIIELACLIFFTVEFVFRFVVCPWKLRLLKNVTTLIDMLYILPAWMVLFVEVTHGTFWHTKNGVTLFIVIEAIEIFRVLRIFRFIKHHQGLRILYLAIKSSMPELSLLLVFVVFNTTIFASFIYCAEAFTPDNFDNAFHGMWWALITMTTVGYGDMYPKSWLGYIVGSFCAVLGIIMIQMPVPIIVSNFHAYYRLRFSNDISEKKEDSSNVELPQPVLPFEDVYNSQTSIPGTSVKSSEVSASPPESRSSSPEPPPRNRMWLPPINKVSVVIDSKHTLETEIEECL
ncbi:potassium voltage-gated channel subfamily C member 3-like isoform X2 [Mytilus trossulus]|uniref:potassium voltage-gated channel subfamily C member 3-like isoform X2 n=1 Tax=Mytilus trossulus TaxID=6551 RepID=UPI003003BFFC